LVGSSVKLETLKEWSREAKPPNDRLDLLLISSDIQRLHPADPRDLAYVEVFRVKFPRFERDPDGYKRDIDRQRPGPRQIRQNAIGIPKHGLCPERRGRCERRTPLVTDVGGGHQILVVLAKLEGPRQDLGWEAIDRRGVVHR